MHRSWPSAGRRADGRRRPRGSLQDLTRHIGRSATFGLDGKVLDVLTFHELGELASTIEVGIAMP